MPIATPQGTLDFKSVDTITFVGASSNTVIDTTTGSLGVGVDGNGPTSNLHVVGHTRLEGDINMLHTANTASIKLNSNVVTEFPRSKKLIKYPRVALTQNALNNGYAAEASTESDGTSSGQAYRLFDGLASGERGYHSAGTMYTSGSTYNGTASITDAHGTQHQGEWIKLQMPTTEKMKLSGFSFSPRYVSTHEYHDRAPYKGVFLGSTDGIGTNWYPIHYFDNVAGSELTTVSRTFENTTNDYYNRIALVVYEVGPNATYGDVLNFAEMELFGVPEYDPEAHGTDVVVKSVPNVPNTDWLEVYYDGQDYTQMPTTVTDKSGNNRTGTSNGGVGFDPTYKAFTFDGSNDYISTTSTATLTYHTASMWIQFDSPGNGWECVYSIAPSTPSGFDNFNLYFHSNYFRLESGVGSNFPYYDFDYDFEIGKWVHLTFIFRGSGLEDCEMYINNKRLSHSSGSQNSTADITLSGTNILRVGAAYSTSYVFDGSIANFRLFNRALTPDEIYQLYAYQKEYFGHGDLSMTLKAGRLGIGTSEPKAALDVRGNLRASGLTVQTVSSTKTDTFSTTGGSSHPVSPGNDVPGLAVTIHPKFANSRILVSYTVSTGAYGRAYLRIQRKQGGSTTTIAPSVGPEANTQNQGKCTTSHSGSGDSSVDSQSFEYYDTIGGTEPITYQIQAWTYHSTYYIYVNRGHDDGNGSNNGTYWARTLSSITAKEVCQ